jgi:hypothetical protein
MNAAARVALNTLRRLYLLSGPNQPYRQRTWTLFSVKEYASRLLATAIRSPQPLMVARFGSTELYCLTNYLGVKHPDHFRSWYSYIARQTPPWWWESRAIVDLCHYSGFFPSDRRMVERFCELMLDDIRDIDILGSWLADEKYFSGELRSAKRVVLEDLEPFFCERPWTHALAGLKVLVVHPFDETIQSQYSKKNLVFPEGLLPDFELQTIRAVQSLCGEPTPFRDWFDALDHMKGEIDRREFDVCLIGCGAYGLPIAAHVKRTGRKAIHLAGSTQLLFGIMGRRWEDYIVYPYMNLVNEHWVRPAAHERPKHASTVENACYW